ncbi:hypothetical protein ACYZ70_001562 [Clostridium botulinum]
MLILLYDNEKLEHDKNFFNYIIDLAYKYLNKDIQQKLSIEYDDFKEI